MTFASRELSSLWCISIFWCSPFMNEGSYYKMLRTIASRGSIWLVITPLLSTADAENVPNTLSSIKTTACNFVSISAVISCGISKSPIFNYYTIFCRSIDGDVICSPLSSCRSGTGGYCKKQWRRSAGSRSIIFSAVSRTWRT